MIVHIADHEIVNLVTDVPWSENYYFVRRLSSFDTLLIDPGDNGDRIVDSLLKEKRDLKAILLTHAHHDHVGAVADVQAQFNVPCYLHKNDYRLFRQAHMYALRFAGKTMQPLTKANLFEDDDGVLIDQWQFRRIYTPGHTQGGVCYFFDGFVFTGDTLLYQHVGRSDIPGADPEQLIRSIDLLFNELPDDTVILPGHGRAWNIAEAKSWWRIVRTDPPQYKEFGGLK